MSLSLLRYCFDNTIDAFLHGQPHFSIFMCDICDTPCLSVCLSIRLQTCLPGRLSSFFQVHIYMVINIAESCNSTLRWRFIIDWYGIRWYETDFDCSVSTQIMCLLLLLRPTELTQQTAQLWAVQCTSVCKQDMEKSTHNEISTCYIGHIANINNNKSNSSVISLAFPIIIIHWFYRWMQKGKTAVISWKL